jgi:hypothetical protein
MLLSSSNATETIVLVSLIGNYYFEVRGDYYAMHTPRIVQSIMDDQTKIIQGDKTIEDLFKTKYLK